ncbi:hypothetical protein M9458_042841, partial [Cirrhinus mrigala]
ESYRGQAGAAGRCDPRVAQSCGRSVHGDGRRSRGHARIDHSVPLSQRGHGRPERRIQRWTAALQQTLAH